MASMQNFQLNIGKSENVIFFDVKPEPANETTEIRIPRIRIGVLSYEDDNKLQLKNLSENAPSEDVPEMVENVYSPDSDPANPEEVANVREIEDLVSNNGYEAGEKNLPPISLTCSAASSNLPTETAAIKPVRVLLNRIFVCSICRLHFSRPSDLKDHLETVNHEKNQSQVTLASQCNSRRKRSAKNIVDYNEAKDGGNPSNIIRPEVDVSCDLHTDERTQSDVALGPHCNFRKQPPSLSLPVIERNEPDCSADPEYDFWQGVDAWTNTEPDKVLTSSLQNNCECHLCHQSFSKSALFHHLCNQANEGPFSCCVCGLSFAFIINLRYHEQDHNESHKCEICGRYFHLPSELKEHMSVHTENVCKINKRFTAEHIVKVHKLKHTGVRKPTKPEPQACLTPILKLDKTTNCVCRHCHKTFSNSAFFHHDCIKAQKGVRGLNFRNQKRNHNKGQKCEICGRYFHFLSRLTRHMRVHSGVKAYGCDICDKRFTSKYYAKFHKMMHTDEKTYKCSLCWKEFRHVRSLHDHIRVHVGEKPYLCNYCGQSFTRRDTLLHHIRRHTGEKPYACPDCGKRFGRKEQITIHRRIHTGEKPYKCTVCGKRFAQSPGLDVHMRYHTGDKPYKCPYCEKYFHSQSRVQSHIWTHSIFNRTFECDYCQNVFPSKHYLVRHILVHTGVKSFRCSYCKRKFNQKASLTRHEKIHTGEKPHKCDHCDKRFIQNGSLQHHLRTHHKDV